MSEDTINKNVEEIAENAAEKQVVIPEFYRDLNADPEQKGLWHYVFRTNGDRKPIKTADGKPHRLDFNWKDMFPNENGHIEVEIDHGQRMGLHVGGIRRRTHDQARRRGPGECGHAAR